MTTIPRVTRDGEPAAAPTSNSEDGVRIRLFDADKTDRQLPLDKALATKPSERQLLWIDIEGELESEQRRAIVDRFDFDDDTDRRLARAGSGPQVQLHGQHFHVRVAAEPDGKQPGRVSWLDIVAGPNVVISRHVTALAFLAKLDERIAADATIGELDSAEFVASMLDATVTTYHAAIDRIEARLDSIDTRALARSDSSDLFSELIVIRREISGLRRVLTAHREVFGAMERPDFGRGIASADPEVFVAVAGRFEGVLVSLEATRESILGSFDILMTRTAQRTNDVMRTLTLATVLALPATITAGFLGMNVVVPVPNNDPLAFWQVFGMVVLLEAAALAIVRVRRWI